MKLTRAEIFRLVAPLAKPYTLSKVCGTLDSNVITILKLETDTGLTGYGEADLIQFGEETPESVAAALKLYLLPELLGKDPRDFASLRIRLDEVLAHNPTAKAAVDIALHDLVGKIYNVPVHVLLGGKVNDTLPILWPISSGTPQDDLHVIDEKFAEGYTTFMLKVGSNSIAEDAARIVAVRDKYGERVHLVVDANEGWSYGDTVEFINRVRDYKVDLLEQPISRKRVKDHERIRQTANMLLSADESLKGVENVEEILTQGNFDVFSLKVTKMGGIWATRRVAQTAEVWGVRCLLNSELELGVAQAASLHVGAASPNLVPFGHSYASVLRFALDCTDFAKYVNKGRVTVPTLPGLGITVDEAVLREKAVFHDVVEM